MGRIVKNCRMTSFFVTRFFASCAGNERLRCLLAALPPRGKGLILDPMVPREGDAGHPASLELIEDRLAPLRRNLDPPQFVALQNLTRSIGLGHTRHSA